MNEATVPTTPRLAPKRLAIAAAIAGAALFGMVLMSLLHRQQVAETPPPPPLPPIYEVQGDVDALQRLNLKTSWAGEDRTPPAPPKPPPVAPALPPPPPLFPTPSPVTPPTPPLVPMVQVTPPPPVPAMTATQQAAPAPAPAVKQAKVEPLKPPAKEEKKERTGTLFSKNFAIAKPPYEDKATQGTAEQVASKQGSLIKEAQWEKPADTSRVWYRSQALVGQLTEDVVSSIPGQVTIKTTRPLESKDLRGVTLVPQQSTVVAQQVGKPDVNQGRLNLEVLQIELPDGSILASKATLADQFGGNGLQGRVENHYGRVLFGAVLSAILSVGVRVPTGNTEGFVPTIGQDVTRSVGNDIAQSGRQIVQRELDRSPTVFLSAGMPVRIHPNDNITLVRGPKIIK